MKIKIALLGGGRICKHYEYIFNKYNLFEFFEIVAACDINPDARDYLKSAFGCPVVHNIVDLFELNDFDVVFVLTPSGLHYQHCKYSLEQGVDVLVEKPICLRYDQAAEIVQISRDTGHLLYVAFQNRFNPAVQFLSDIVSTNQIGSIHSASVSLKWCRHQSYYQDGWHGTWKMDGGVLSQQAIHHVDVLNLLNPVQSVYASSYNLVNNLEAEDTLHALVKFTNGGSGIIDLTTSARNSDLEASLTVLGSEGSVSLGGIALNKVLHCDIPATSSFYNKDFRSFNVDVPTGYGLSHHDLLIDLYKCVMGRRESSVISLDSCLSSLNLIHSIYASSESSSWVSTSRYLQSNQLGL